jgi:hypothetical protein
MRAVKRGDRFCPPSLSSTKLIFTKKNNVQKQPKKIGCNLNAGHISLAKA